MRVRKISAAEPVSALRYVKIVENGEPMVDFRELCPDLRIDPPRFHYRREYLMRRSLAEKLCIANQALPDGYHLSIVEGWRPPHIQRRMYLHVWNMFRERHPDWSEVTLKRVVNRFSAPLDSRVPPPHTTGGAVDLMLTDQDGNAQDLCSPYDPYDPESFSFAAPKLSELARYHRHLLATTLLPTGITNYPSEYWHWSYGDQGWAYRGNHPHAIYSAITPFDWQPDPEDLLDTPLELLERE